MCPKPFFVFFRFSFFHHRKNSNRDNFPKQISSPTTGERLSFTSDWKAWITFATHDGFSGPFDSFFCVSGFVFCSKFFEQRWISYEASDCKVVWVGFQANWMHRKAIWNVFCLKILSTAWCKAFSLGSENLRVLAQSGKHSYKRLTCYLNAFCNHGDASSSREEHERRTPTCGAFLSNASHLS